MGSSHQPEAPRVTCRSPSSSTDQTKGESSQFEISSASRLCPLNLNHQWIANTHPGTIITLNPLILFLLQLVNLQARLSLSQAVRVDVLPGRLGELADEALLTVRGGVTAGDPFRGVVERREGGVVGLRSRGKGNG